MSVNAASLPGFVPKGAGKSAGRGDAGAQTSRQGFDEALAGGVAGRKLHGPARHDKGTDGRLVVNVGQVDTRHGPDKPVSDRPFPYFDGLGDEPTPLDLPDEVLLRKPCDIGDADPDRKAEPKSCDIPAPPDVRREPPPCDVSLDGPDEKIRAAADATAPDAGQADGARAALEMLEALAARQPVQDRAPPAPNVWAGGHNAVPLWQRSAQPGDTAWSARAAAGMPTLRLAAAGERQVPAGDPRHSIASARPAAAQAPAVQTAPATQPPPATVGEAVTATAAGRPGADAPPTVQSAGATPAGEQPVGTSSSPTAGGKSANPPARVQPDTTQPEPARPGGNAPEAATPRVNVLGFSAALPPAASTPAQLLGPTAAGLVAAIEAEPTWRAAAAEAAASVAQRGQPAAQSVNSLRIQLNPAELGMVTARLTATGSQLSIEIQAESNDARQRLAGDSEAIVKALRAIGYDVDKVTIQQAPQGNAGSAQQGGSAGREQAFADQHARDEQGAKGQGGRNAAERDGQGGRNGTGEAAAQRAGGGVYI